MRADIVGHAGIIKDGRLVAQDKRPVCHVAPVMGIRRLRGVKQDLDAVIDLSHLHSGA
jgi:hypothetical protein